MTTIPEWLQWFAGGVGLLLISVLGKLGWSSAKVTTPVKPDVISAPTLNVTELTKAVVKLSESIDRVNAQLKDNEAALVSLRNEINISREVFRNRRQ